MTEAELDEALSRIQAIENFACQPGPEAFDPEDRAGWILAWDSLQLALGRAAERLRTFIRVETPGVGITLTNWTGDVSCVWTGATGREQHMARFAGEFQFRIRLWTTLAAAAKAAVTIGRAGAAPWTAGSALRAAWELAGELEKLYVAR